MVPLVRLEYKEWRGLLGLPGLQEPPVLLAPLGRQDPPEQQVLRVRLGRQVPKALRVRWGRKASRVAKAFPAQPVPLVQLVPLVQPAWREPQV